MTKPNRLAREKSPYLLQHARNPVDWYPWGPEAFRKAASEDKMIFLSIGYSTCHWCHVMERESFESPEIAELLNRDFVPVKVDREERPDVDHLYMSAVQAMTGAGGWPLTVFLTPDGQPVTGGTYFPPEDRWGRPGMKTVLPRLAQMWRSEKDQMLQAGEELTGHLKQKNQLPAAQDGEDIFQKAYTRFLHSFDSERGGFGSAPKFPRSHELSLLLRYWKKNRAHDALRMTEKTLRAMAQGGIYDHLGGGFHRYSTDENWLVPHFEKMLYDQAIIAGTYIEAGQASGNTFYFSVARDIFRYVLNDMTSPEGAFYSAEDADSEGEEGKFYVWRPEEIVQALGPQAGKLFCDFYGVTDEGNFEHAASVLSVAKNVEEFAREKNLDPGEVEKLLLHSREKLLKLRSGRIAPYKDDKILTAWNGLMISALARGAAALGEQKYAQAAARAASFVLGSMRPQGRLLRRFREAEAAIPAFQEDYAFFALGLLDLYEADFQVRWLEESVLLAEEMIRLFWDSAEGGFFMSAQDGEKLVVRSKEYYDGATPSGNSVAALLLLKLWRLTGRENFGAAARRLIEIQMPSLAAHPVAYPQFLMAVDFASSPSREIIFSGSREHPDFQKFYRRVAGGFDPFRIMAARPAESSPDLEAFNRLIPFGSSVKNTDQPAVYICENYACRQPVTSVQELEKVFGNAEKV